MARAVESTAVELRNLSKRFGNVHANVNINLRVRTGSIHGVIGENGAGKSTAMNMLYGFFPPDHGSIHIFNESCAFFSPLDALKKSIGMVHQHFVLSQEETAVDNVILGAEQAFVEKWGFLPAAIRPLNRNKALNKLRSLANEYGFDIPWEKPVSELSVGQQQRVEILKLLYRDARILILDEPTAVLTPQETEQIFKQLRKLRDQGKSIILITHKLKEVLQICDEITVFRGGRVVGTRMTADTDENELAELMVGRHIDLKTRSFVAPSNSTPILEVTHLNMSVHGIQKLSNLSFQIKPKEILGIAGVQGNGQSELHHVLLNPSEHFENKVCSGTLRLNGRDIRTKTTAQLFNMGVASIAEDRLRESVIADFSVEDNFLLGLHRFAKFAHPLWIFKKTLRQALFQSIQRFDIKASDSTIPLRTLSGGNQQKIVVARELEKSPVLLVASQPTRGVDVGAIEFIHHQIRLLQSSGAAVLLISSELSELMALSTRILVFCRGQIAGEFNPETCTEKELGLAMGGALSGSGVMP